MDRIIDITQKDQTLAALKTAINKGYIPASDSLLTPYAHIMDELTISDEGLILKGSRIILPEALWEEAVNKAHQGSHPGTASIKRHIRSHFWFPTLNKIVESKIKQCNTCQVFTNKSTKEPIAT